MSDAILVGNAVLRTKGIRGAEIEVAMISIEEARRTVENGTKRDQVGKDQPLPRAANVEICLAILVFRQ